MSANRAQLDLRPLDLVGSIKVKLGLLVTASVVSTAVIVWYGLLVLNLHSRLTLSIAVLVALAVTQVLAHGMTSPLRQMTAAAREMAAGRSPGPIRATSRDEVGQLARAFMAMASDLATADGQRRELLANVGHELRTPVAALRAELENLVDGVRVADEAALRDALAQVERLGILVDDLLDLARAEAGATALDRRPVRVAPLVDDVVRQVTAARPGRRVHVDVQPTLIAHVDPGRLRQVLANLLDNAARHAPGGGQVKVLARSDPRGTLVLEVSDDGPGIPPQLREAVFERFTRGPDPSTPGQGISAVTTPSRGPSSSEIPVRQDGGTGLGLAIARWAVALHGGTIDVVPSLHGCHIRAVFPPPPLPGASAESPSTTTDSSHDDARRTT